ncbi:tetraspanin-1 [Canis lupus baileyi]|uniref:Tetraspanin n=3 Tax=Canis lupus TaxID=9612 RepID=A0A8C0SU32_CANLF|nr:tetraspanin-1 [Canis lupus familiaris]XP_025276041.1 tetraspanin-1 [Canis lupus dingo]XP_038414127.1 tetraspanin-1 [Canis lupus familiaris]XP_038543745.1 tetraspanin-1 [Canis lupus familiaris]XP_048950416.1 tetraspanin-1 [Canis lupus dingo]XP_048950417.1 tetraspanin-1 [Canis lupus dingo]XP_048950418.1 tetraspanin-1 [Canis lupus dingo]XP_048950419.1 tetraspanin-1 [Canis lupus dingo]|eukprot:XP_005629095.1 tetraspanin-1 [Canis lupus familiaris]
MQCFGFIKTMMILFNFLIFLCGVALLAVGIWVSVDGPSFLKIFGPLSSSAMQFVNVGYFLIAAGAILFALGFLGCYGAHSENKCALMMFFLILLLIFIAEVAAAVVALVYTTMAEHFLTLLVVPAIKQDYGSQKDFTQVWNSTMAGLGCCGFNNYTDFEGSPYFLKNHTFPPYCCSNSGNGTATEACTEERAKDNIVQGCFSQLLYDLRANAVTVGGVAAGIGALELAAMIVSMYLYCNLK